MSAIDEVIEDLSHNRKNIRFAHLVRVCEEHFGCEEFEGAVPSRSSCGCTRTPKRGKRDLRSSRLARREKENAWRGVK